MNNTLFANLHSSKDDWRTPKDLFIALNTEFHFTLDPCSTHENTLCEKHYTKEEDGLSQNWGGEIVFMNPPYGKEIGKWIQKAYQESLNNAIVVCLIPSRTDTSYWHKYIFPYAAKILFIRRRLHFSNSKREAGFPSAIVVFDKTMQGYYASMPYK